MSLTIKLGSVTNAQRARKILSQNGYSSKLSRLSNPKSGDGCGYVLHINSSDSARILQILESSGIKVLGSDDV
ncbi:MAG: DUF3343 domain-containing protein [Eubacterium sp.]|nr:DUF3343 domain-containing protein [Eubacterium sp.]